MLDFMVLHLLTLAIIYTYSFLLDVFCASLLVLLSFRYFSRVGQSGRKCSQVIYNSRICGVYLLVLCSFSDDLRARICDL
jgi:accessory gene regulator protein AgrB